MGYYSSAFKKRFTPTKFPELIIDGITLERETVTSFWMDLLIKLPYGKLVVTQFPPECLNA